MVNQGKFKSSITKAQFKSKFKPLWLGNKCTNMNPESFYNAVEPNLDLLNLMFFQTSLILYLILFYLHLKDKHRTSQFSTLHVLKQTPIKMQTFGTFSQHYFFFASHLGSLELKCYTM